MRVASSENKNGGEILMKVLVLEPILKSCFDGVTLSYLVSCISKLFPIANDLVKKYLFYMIEFRFLTYSGSTKSFFITKDGIHLLGEIELIKSNEGLNSSQIFLQINVK
jgi:hypothetical protein